MSVLHSSSLGHTNVTLSLGGHFIVRFHSTIPGDYYHVSIVISQLSTVAVAVVGCINVDCSSWLTPLLLVCNCPTCLGMGCRTKELGSSVLYLASHEIHTDSVVFSFLLLQDRGPGQPSVVLKFLLHQC